MSPRPNSVYDAKPPSGGGERYAVTVELELEHTSGLKPAPEAIADKLAAMFAGELLVFSVSEPGGGFGSGRVNVRAVAANARSVER